MEQYINKAALVAEIERRITAYQKNFDKADNKIARLSTDGRMQSLKELLSFLDTLEVKEVDYERELSKYVSNGIHRFFPNVNDDYCKMDSVIWQDYVIETAKNFYELGLKAKGE